MSAKKPLAFVLITVLALSCLLFAACFLLSPLPPINPPDDEGEPEEEIVVGPDWRDNDYRYAIDDQFYYRIRNNEAHIEKVKVIKSCYIAPEYINYQGEKLRVVLDNPSTVWHTMPEGAFSYQDVVVFVLYNQFVSNQLTDFDNVVTVDVQTKDYREVLSLYGDAGTLTPTSSNPLHSLSAGMLPNIWEEEPERRFGNYVVSSVDRVVMDDSGIFVVQDDGATLVKCNISNFKITVPKTVKYGKKNVPVAAIGHDAFHCRYAVEEIVLPDTVTHIASQNMRVKCNVPNSLVTLDSSLFFDVEDSITVYEGLPYVGNKNNPYYIMLPTEEVSSFNVHPDCKIICSATVTQQPSVIIPHGVTSLNLYLGDGVKELSLPSTLIHFYASGSTVEKLTLEEGLQTLNLSCLYNYSLTEVEIPSSVTKLENIESQLLRSPFVTHEDNLCYLGTKDNPYHFLVGIDPNVSKPQTFTVNPQCKVVAQLFRHWGDYTYEIIFNSSFVLPDGLEAILDNAHLYSSTLVIPSSVKYIGEEGIYEGSLTLITNKESAGEYHVENTLTYFDVSNGQLYKKIDGVLYRNCNDEYAEVISISNMPVCTIVETVDFDKISLTVKNIALAAGRWASLAYVGLPDSIEYISDGAFYQCNGLVSVNAPASLKEIGRYAFADTDIEVFYLDSNVTVKRNAFVGTSRLLLLIGDERTDKNELAHDETFFDITTYGATVVFGCTPQNYCSNLDFSVRINSDKTLTVLRYTGIDTYLTFPTYLSIDNEYLPITEIYDRAFINDTRITYVNLPQQLKRIGEKAFYGCKNLKEIVMHSGIEYIGPSAFCGIGVQADDNGYVYVGPKENPHLYCVSAPTSGNVSFKDDCKYIGDNCLGSNSIYHNTFWISTLHIPASVQYIGSCAFDGMTGISSLTLPKGLTTLGYRSFANTDLREIVLPEGLTEIPEECFFYSKQLSSVTIPAGVKKIGASAFGRSALTSVTICGATEIGNNAFAENAQLTSCELPEGLLKIGTGAFSYSSLTSVNLPSTLQEIGDHAFAGLTNLNGDSVLLPDGLKYIGTGAFSGTALKYLSLPDSVTFVGANFVDYDVRVRVSDKLNYFKFDFDWLYSVDQLEK